MRLRLLVAFGALGALLTLPVASASAAPPAPFGHACAASDGALLCPTAADAARIPSFDGVPLDVDVYLPPTGDGPFPTIAMLHGFAQSKTANEAGGPASTTNAAFYARNRYAVLVPSARGFGRSCGVPDSRTPNCARGWLHLADLRFEARDVQYLLGLLVDRGVVRLRSRIAVSLRLNGNGYRFARGHTVKVEVLGRDAPTYRPSNGTFSVTLSRMRVAMPTRERIDRLAPIRSPARRPSSCGRGGGCCPQPRPDASRSSRWASRWSRAARPAASRSA